MLTLAALAAANTWDAPTLALLLPDGTALPLDGQAVISPNILGPSIEVLNTGPTRGAIATTAADLLRAHGWQDAPAASRADPRAIQLQRGPDHVALRSLVTDTDTTLWVDISVPIPPEWAFLGVDPTTTVVYLADTNRILLREPDPQAPVFGTIFSGLRAAGWTATQTDGSFSFHKADAELSVVLGPGVVIVTREGTVPAPAPDRSFNLRLSLPGGGALDATSATLEWREGTLCVSGDQGAWRTGLTDAGWQPEPGGPLFRREDRQARLVTHPGESCLAFEVPLGFPWLSFAGAADRAFVSAADTSQLVLETPTDAAKKTRADVDAALRTDGWRATGPWTVRSRADNVTLLARSWTRDGNTLDGERFVEPTTETLMLHPAR